MFTLPAAPPVKLATIDLLAPVRSTPPVANLVALPGLGGTALSFPARAFQDAVDAGVAVYIADYNEQISSVAAMAHGVWTAILAAGIDEQVFLLGYSMGGFVAQSMYLQAPTRVAGLILLSTACLTLADMVTTFLGGKHTHALRSFMRGARPRDVPDAGIVSRETFEKELAAVVAHVISNAGKFMQTVNNCPIASIYGSKDKVICVESMARLRQVASQTPFNEYVFPDAGHDLIYTQPSALAALLAQWLLAHASTQ
jgi:pimeloyl-ACP methyl ester carboxylesterase